MRKLICPLMFCDSHDATHFLRINIFVKEGGLRLVLYWVKKDCQNKIQYNTENCYYYMFPFLCIELYNRNTHTQNILIVLVCKSPQPHMMFPYFIFVRSAFSLFLLVIFDLNGLNQYPKLRLVYWAMTYQIRQAIKN